ncbi:MAG: hypothetical protein HYW50_05040, partial [Candidatus Diapherotrites archaeon]|nr:hypothetical protein [Candidatus Diapherotrites archaeon]
TATEIEQMRQDPQVMQTINRISGAFGGNAKIVFEINDESETIVWFFLSVDKTTLVKMEFPEQKPEEVDAAIKMNYGFFYDTMSTIIKDLEGSQTVKPYWEEGGPQIPEIDDTLIMIGLFTRIILAIPFGQVEVEPITSIPSVILSLGDLVGLMQMK